MSILYKVVERKNPQSPSDPPKFYPQIVRSQNITFNQLAKEIAARSTVSRADALAVLATFSDLIVEHLLNSNGVRLAELGIFSASLQGVGAKTLDEFNAKDNIKNVRLQFNAAKPMKDELNHHAEFKRVD